MKFVIRLGVPEMHRLWIELTEKAKTGKISTSERLLFVKWGKAMKLLSHDPFHPGLQTHEIKPLSMRYGIKVFQSYLENSNSRAMRMYWVYGSDRQSITVIGLEPHPENNKNGAYDRISLSDMPKIISQ